MVRARQSVQRVVSGQNPGTARISESLRDLPTQGTPVLIQVRVTRWRCVNDPCARRTFGVRRPDLSAPFARRTTRMASIVRLFGHARVDGRPNG
jgi:hypothetical protein